MHPDDPEYMLYKYQMRGPGSGYNQTFHKVSDMVASSKIQTSLGKPGMVHRKKPSFSKEKIVEAPGGA